MDAEIERIVNQLIAQDGFQAHAFKVGWYNELVSKPFHLDHHEDTLGLVIISTPAMFEHTFVPFVHEQLKQLLGIENSSNSSFANFTKINEQEKDGIEKEEEKLAARKMNQTVIGNNNSIEKVLLDPMDQCMHKFFDALKNKLIEHPILGSLAKDTVVHHDFELNRNRRPVILMQTAGHVSGAAFYYRRKKQEKEETRKKDNQGEEERMKYEKEMKEKSTQGKSEKEMRRKIQQNQCRKEEMSTKAICNHGKEDETEEKEIRKTEKEIRKEEEEFEGNGKIEETCFHCQQIACAIRKEETWSERKISHSRPSLLPSQQFEGMKGREEEKKEEEEEKNQLNGRIVNGKQIICMGGEQKTHALNVQSKNEEKRKQEKNRQVIDLSDLEEKEEKMNEEERMKEVKKKNEETRKKENEQKKSSGGLEGVSIHPVFGGWFAFRTVLILPHVQVKDMPRKCPQDVIRSNVEAEMRRRSAQGRARKCHGHDSGYHDCAIELLEKEKRDLEQSRCYHKRRMEKMTNEAEIEEETERRTNQLIDEFLFNWMTNQYRSFGMEPEATYSPRQQQYFATKPGQRMQLLMAFFHEDQTSRHFFLGR